MDCRKPKCSSNRVLPIGPRAIDELWFGDIVSGPGRRRGQRSRTALWTYSLKVVPWLPGSIYSHNNRIANHGSFPIERVSATWLPTLQLSKNNYHDRRNPFPSTSISPSTTRPPLCRSAQPSSCRGAIRTWRWHSIQWQGAFRYRGILHQ